jgi:hypothetical protein
VDPTEGDPLKDISEQRAEFTEQIESSVHEVLKEFQELELTQMRKGEIKARAKLAEVNKTFTRKREAVADELKKAGQAGSAAWTDAKKGVESAWEELRAAVDEARAEFTDAEADEKTSRPA